MRLLVLALILVAGAGCRSQAVIEAEAARKQQIEDQRKAIKERAEWLEVNRFTTVDDEWVVLDVRASYLLAVEPAVVTEKSGNPALGAATGGGTAALLGLGPVGIIAAGAIGAAAFNGGVVQQASVDAATCVLIARKAPDKTETFIFHAKQTPERTGVCLTSRPGDTIVFRTTRERQWYYTPANPAKIKDVGYLHEISDSVHHHFLLIAKPPV